MNPILALTGVMQFSAGMYAFFSQGNWRMGVVNTLIGTATCVLSTVR